MILILFFIIVAYLFGSLSTAIIVCHLLHLPDPRKQGSGNPGATNVLRFGGKKIAILVLIGDLLKGLIPVLIAKWCGISHLGLAWIGLAAIVGHIFPVFFGFKGGKGVATGAGVMFGLNWLFGLFVFMTWLIIALITRYSSLAAIIASVSLPIYGFWFVSHVTLFPLILITVFLLWRHHDNLKRLMIGQEDKIGQKKNEKIDS